MGIRVYGWMVFEHIHIEGSTVKRVSECMVGWFLNIFTYKVQQSNGYQSVWLDGF